jgi:hypothetical protein
MINLNVPLVASVPPQPELPDDVQVVASTDDQVMEVEVPAGIEFAPSVSVGAAGTWSASTVKVALLVADEPAELVHASV